jgi:hypothetical protein
MKFPVFRYGQPLLKRTWSDTLSIIISALFVVAALIVHRQLSALEFWVSIIFFGGGGLFTLLSMLRSKKSDALAEQRTADYHKRIREETGHFTYPPGGFIFDQHADKPFYRWTDIQSAFAYWTTYWDDRSSTTEIVLEIFLEDNNRMRITESLPGWYQFNKRLGEEIHGFPGAWQQAFESSDSETTSKRLLYDKGGRAQEVVEKECYP